VRRTLWRSCPAGLATFTQEITGSNPVGGTSRIACSCRLPLAAAALGGAQTASYGSDCARNPAGRRPLASARGGGSLIRSWRSRKQSDAPTPELSVWHCDSKIRSTGGSIQPIAEQEPGPGRQQSCGRRRRTRHATRRRRRSSRCPAMRPLGRRPLLAESAADRAQRSRGGGRQPRAAVPSPLQPTDQIKRDVSYCHAVASCLGAARRACLRSNPLTVYGNDGWGPRPESPSRCHGFY